MRISRSTVLIGILVVLIAFTTVWHLAHRRPEPVPEKSASNAPSFVQKPRSADEILAAILKPGAISRFDIEELLAGDKSLVRPDAASLEQEFRRTLKSPPIITTDYDVPTEDYVPKGTHAWLQPLVASKVTESDDEIRWFEWLDDDTLVYSTLKGVYRKNLHGPPELLARAPMARASVPCLSPDRRSVAAVVWGAVMVVGTETGERRLHAFDKPISDITWSPDSRLVGFTTRTALWTLDPGTGKMYRLYHAEQVSGEWWSEDKPLPVVSTDDVQWSPDGRHISIRQPVWGDFTYTAFTVVQSMSGRVVSLIGCWDQAYPSWSPDSRTVAYGDSGGDVDGRALASDVFNQKERLDFCGGTDTSYGRSAWSSDGRFVAFEYVGRGYDPVQSRYRTLDVFEPEGVASRPCPVASRPLPFEWHPTRHVTASVVETKPAIQDYMKPFEDVPAIAWRLELAWVSRHERDFGAQAGNPADVSTPIQMPPIAGRKQTPRWSPDGTKLAVLCDLSGQYQVYVTGLVSQERNQRNAGTWLRSSQEYLKTEESGKAVACLQNAVRLGAPPEARSARHRMCRSSRSMPG